MTTSPTASGLAWNMALRAILGQAVASRVVTNLAMRLRSTGLLVLTLLWEWPTGLSLSATSAGLIREGGSAYATARAISSRSRPTTCAVSATMPCVEPAAASFAARRVVSSATWATITL